ncbi:coiled-coil domain-containing protein 170 [Poecilia formosa]|uniref:coiled-coil domain-containing protein 170-like n=1 Tax=Poecilia formosa TaxID=48698 RepID=UPI000443A132|nr:PREDICTED: coiled-coil domain-containing protein 170-like [Poecilia formosa]XP_007567160.1 PREDICTED: coiled-coil domain-containing protein 170-like [Poecilia formosa]
MEILENSDEEERLRMRIAVLEENVKSCELECKASRETAQRLMAELDQEKKKTAGSAAALDSLKEELEGLVVGRRGVETEKRTLSESLDASRRVIEAARRESCCLEKRVEECKSKARAAELKLQRFLEKVAGLLQEKTELEFLPTERDVLHHLDGFCNKTVSQMEVRLRHTSEELKQLTALQLGTLQRAQLAEQQAQDLRRQLQSLETEQLEAELHRDELQRSNKQYEEFVERLSETMKVDGIDPDLGFDMRLKLVRSRAEQLDRQEAAALVESKMQTYSLKQKVKSQKDQLDRKDLHVQLLRKKVLELEEERRRSRSVLSAEQNDALLEARKLKKRLERLQAELRATKLSNTELKAQLTHTDELKLKVTEQSQSEQEQKTNLLLDGKAKEEKKLSGSNLQDQEKKMREEREEREELNVLRLSLTQLSDRQRELLDFQSKVSQTLGLNSTSLSLSNNEIIKLLEELLHSHHHHHHVCCHHGATPWHCSTHHSLPLLPDLQEGRFTPDDSVSGSPFAAI